MHYIIYESDKNRFDKLIDLFLEIDDIYLEYGYSTIFKFSFGVKYPYIYVTTNQLYTFKTIIKRAISSNSNLAIDFCMTHIKSNIQIGVIHEKKCTFT